MFSACPDEHQKQQEASRNLEAGLRAQVAELEAKLSKAEGEAAQASQNMSLLEKDCERLRAQQQNQAQEMEAARQAMAKTDEERTSEQLLFAAAQTELEKMRDEVVKAAEHEARAVDLQEQLESAQRRISEAKSGEDPRMREAQWSRQRKTLEGTTWIALSCACARCWSWGPPFLLCIV